MGSYCRPRFVHGRVPPELISEIICYCSPFDLLQLQLTCKHFYYLLKQNDSYWDLALEHLGVPNRPILRSPGNWSASAFSQFLFGGGPCTICKTWAEDLPASFLLRFRACSDNCLSDLLDIRSPAIYNPYSEDVKLDAQISCWLPYRYYHWAGRHAYSRSDAISALREYQQAIMIDCQTCESNGGIDGGEDVAKLKFVRRSTKQLAAAWEMRKDDLSVLVSYAGKLEPWIMKYHVLYKKNAKNSEDRKSRLKVAARISRVNCETFITTPVVSRIIRAFNRDLTPLNSAVWESIGQAALTEISRVQKTESAPSARKFNFSCNKCARRFESRMALRAHFDAMHRTDTMRKRGRFLDRNTISRQRV